MAFNTFFTEMILPFLLVFVLVFAILQKSKLLGDGKKQIDAMVGLVVGLLLIGLPGPREFVVNFIPWIAVGLGVILMYFLLYGFVGGDVNAETNKGHMKVFRIVFAVLAGLFVIGVLLYVTGLWQNYIGGWLSGAGAGDWVNILIVVVVIAAAIWVVAASGGKKDDHDHKGK